MKWVPLESDGRTPEDRLIDRALLLLAVNAGEKAGEVDAFRMMKVPFSVQYAMNKKSIGSFSYSFYRDNYGPISTAIYDDRRAFLHSGLINYNPKTTHVHLTDLGSELSAIVSEMIASYPHNKPIVDLVVQQAEHFAAMTFADIKNEVYALKVTTEVGVITVKDAPHGTQLSEKLSTESCDSYVSIPDTLRNTLAIAFALTEQQVRASRRDSGKTMAEVFAGV